MAALPAGEKRLQEHLQFLLTNLSYEHERCAPQETDGRAAPWKYCCSDSRAVPGSDSRTLQGQHTPHAPAAALPATQRRCATSPCCSGREAALDMLGVVLQKFPEQLVAQWAEMVSG